MSTENKHSSKGAKLRLDSLSDIQLKIAESQKELTDLRIRKGTGQVENPLRLRTLRREIARLHTIAAEKTKTHTATATNA
ncbi:MAG: 50S ribosomal protein L29 [Puniceicoccales bacterium]|jgi:large subunit ribosomal protein L29|nr:50S ribosomal protein L29 [Puniceicoccales bacterium]